MKEAQNKSKCRLGFSCALIMHKRSLRADQCPNREACRELVSLEFDDRLPFVIMKKQGKSWDEEYLDLSRSEAAVMMLMQRGCPQALDDFGLLDSIDTIVELLGNLRSQIESFQGDYIAPDGCEMHTYNVKHDYVEGQRDGQGQLIPIKKKKVYSYHIIRQAKARKNGV